MPAAEGEARSCSRDTHTRVGVRVGGLGAVRDGTGRVAIPNGSPQMPLALVYQMPPPSERCLPTGWPMPRSVGSSTCRGRRVGGAWVVRPMEGHTQADGRSTERQSSRSGRWSRWRVHLHLDPVALRPPTRQAGGRPAARIDGRRLGVLVVVVTAASAAAASSSREVQLAVDVDRKGRVAAGVGGRARAVDVDERGPVDRSKVQPHRAAARPAPRCRQREGAPVAHAAVARHRSSKVEAAQRRLDGEGHAHAVP